MDRPEIDGPPWHRWTDVFARQVTSRTIQDKKVQVAAELVAKEVALELLRSQVLPPPVVLNRAVHLFPWY